MPDEERDIRTEWLLGDTIEVLPERPPARDEAVRAQGQLDRLAAHVGDRGQGVAAVARQLRRVALVQVAGQPSVEEERAVRVAVRIDEPRRDDPASDVDDGLDLTGVDRRQIAHREDPVAEDADVGGTSRAARPVDQGPAPEQQVECGHAAMVTRSSDDLPSHDPD